MPYHIAELDLPDHLHEHYLPGMAGPRLQDLAKLNVFIGPNNSGKSRLLRELFAASALRIAPREEQYGKARRLFVEATECLAELPGAEEHIAEVTGQLHAAHPPLFAESGDNPQKTANKQVELIQNLRGSESFQAVARSSQGAKLRNLINRLRDMYRDMANRPPAIPKFKRIYVPSLRGLRAPENEPAFYLRRTLNDYFSDAPRLRKAVKEAKENSFGSLAEIEIITGLELYAEVRAHLLGTLAQRQLIQNYQIYLANRFFEGQPVALIPREGDDVLHIKIGTEAEQPVYNLGDGLQQLIILTMPLFIHHDKDLLLFIEEPELYLHPGFQRSLIDSILDDSDCAGSRQAFVATHSHQFLDITLDDSSVSIYKFDKSLAGDDGHEQHAVVDVINTTNADFTLLAKLGVRNSSVLLANCTVWVEGITDRLYLRKFLELYQHDKAKQFQEDIHYAFVEYGGGNITHWSFLDEEKGMRVERICGNLFLIADRDEGKDPRHRKLSEVLGDRFWRLTSREIENVLSPEVIAAVIRSYEGEDVRLHPFQKTAYRDKPLGRFIDEKVLVDATASVRNRGSGSPYAAASGTIKQKVDFARRAVARMNSVEHLSGEAWNLAERLYQFIEKQNE